MNTAAWLLLGTALVVASIDWFAVATRRLRLEYFAKPTAALAFLATAVALDAGSGAGRVWFCVALGACVVGDVFLMLPSDSFVFGLGAFLVAQLCFTVGFAVDGVTETRMAIGVVVVAAVGAPLAWRFVRALRATDAHKLVAPVVAYVVVISAMTVSAIGAGNPWAIAGAALFFSSDALIAETRFVAPRPWGRVAVMVTYHVALAGLVVSLV